MGDASRLLADLARAKATFQLRAIKATMGIPDQPDTCRRCGHPMQPGIAMIQHAIGAGNDVFIEPDTGRRLSDARAALAKIRGE